MAAAGLVMLLGAGLIGVFVMSQKGTLRANGKRRRRGRKRMRRNGHIRQPGDRGPTTIKASPQRRARAAKLLRMARGHEEAMYASAKNANHLAKYGYIDDAVSAKNDFLRHQKEAGRLRDAALEITSPRLVKLKRNGSRSLTRIALAIPDKDLRAVQGELDFWLSPRRKAMHLAGPNRAFPVVKVGGAHLTVGEAARLRPMVMRRLDALGWNNYPGMRTATGRSVRR